MVQGWSDGILNVIWRFPACLTNIKRILYFIPLIQGDVIVTKTSQNRATHQNFMSKK